jgi:hypothetical protein
MRQKRDNVDYITIGVAPLNRTRGWLGLGTDELTG